MTLRVLLIVVMTSTLVSVQGGTPPQPTPSVSASAASAIAERAASAIVRFEDDVVASETAWRAQFVGRLKRGRSVLLEADVFELRRAQTVVDEMRRDMRQMEVSRARRELNAATVTARALLGRWQLRRDETAMAARACSRQALNTSSSSARSHASFFEIVLHRHGVDGGDRWCHAAIDSHESAGRPRRPRRARTTALRSAAARRHVQSARLGGGWMAAGGSK